MAELEVHGRILRLLESGGASFRELEHAPTRTSEDSARVRGEPLAVGGKAMVLKAGDAFALFVLSAARRLDSRKVKDRLGVRDLRFATPEELLSLTGLVPGAVPPFGRPVLPLDLYVDVSLLHNDRVAFNAGSLTRSIVMGREDYLRLAAPLAVFDFSR